MLCDYEFKNNNLIISYIDKTGAIKLKYKAWNRPTKFITTGDDDPQKSGRFVTWDGRSVKEIYTKYPNKYSIYDFIDNLPKKKEMKFIVIMNQIYFLLILKMRFLIRNQNLI
jgi:hypothetical protein